VKLSLNFIPERSNPNQLSFLLDNIKKNFKMSEYLNLGLPSSLFTVAVLDVFSVNSSGLHFWRIALYLVCKSRSRSSLFNLKFDLLLWPRQVF
jgi:hypothetical protein